MITKKQETKAIDCLEALLKAIANRRIWKMHDYMEATISCTKRSKTGMSIRDCIPEDTEDEILRKINNCNFVYIKRVQETGELYCCVYDINIKSFYFNLTVNLRKNPEKTNLLVKAPDFKEVNKNVDEGSYFIMLFKPKYRGEKNE